MAPFGLTRLAALAATVFAFANATQAQVVIKENPPGVAAPIVPEYSHLAVVPPGTQLLYLAGQLGIRPDGSLPTTFDDQVIQAYENVRTILASKGAKPQDIVKMSIYAVGEPVDPKRLATFRSEFFAGTARPPSTFVYVTRLARAEFLVEVEVVAALPARSVLAAKDAPSGR